MKLPYNHDHYTDPACIWWYAWLDNYSFYNHYVFCFTI